MIVGNPKAGRWFASVAIALLVVMFVIGAIIISRKPESPTKAPPVLRPSMVVVPGLR